MTPAEHRETAENLLDFVSSLGQDLDSRNAIVAEAQVHATLALAPAPPPPAQPQQQRRVDIDRLHTFADAQGEALDVWPTNDKSGVLIGHTNGEPWFMDDPAQLRTLASLLTAHADRLESKP